MKLFTHLALLLVSVSFVSTASVAHARHGDDRSYENAGDQNGGFRKKHNYPQNQEDQENNGAVSTGTPADDSALVNAVNAHKGANFLEGSGMVVTQLLPDDTQGLEHQKWMVRLSNGKQMMAVYNTDMCPRVPLHEGDVVAMGGQFIWTNDGGLLHWLHHDPKGHRPDGYVMVNGQYYCKD